MRFSGHDQTTPLCGGAGGWWFDSVSVVIASGKRPVPFRTRKLSLTAPMVLPGVLGGRVGRRRTFVVLVAVAPQGSWGVAPATNAFWRPDRRTLTLARRQPAAQRSEISHA